MCIPEFVIAVVCFQIFMRYLPAALCPVKGVTLSYSRPIPLWVGWPSLLNKLEDQRKVANAVADWNGDEATRVDGDTKLFNLFTCKETGYSVGIRMSYTSVRLCIVSLHFSLTSGLFEP